MPEGRDEARNEATKTPSELELEVARLDFAAIHRTLRNGRASNTWLGRWLRLAYAAPDSFMRALYAHVALRRGGLKSGAEGPFDFYYDCVAAHLGVARPALISSRGLRREELTYESLHARVGALASSWTQAGAAAGDSICVCAPIGVDFAVALLCALRLGLTITALPPEGRRFLENRLRGAEPNWVVTTERLQDWVLTLGFPILPLVGGRDVAAPSSFSYPADAAVLRCHPVFGGAELEPVEVSAALLHSSLLRDATLVFALDERDVLAAPGFEPLAWQPALLLSALFSGAAFAVESVPATSSAVDWLETCGVTLLGVRRELSELILANPGYKPARLRAWFRSLTDELDLSRADALARWSQARGIAAFNLVSSVTAGGALLLGPVLTEPLDLSVWPAPGRAWQLTEVGGGMLEALTDTGVYTPLAEDEPLPAVPRLLLASAAEGYLCGGALESGPDTLAYPIEEVSAAVEHHPAVAYASVVVSPGRHINTAKTTLLVFVAGDDKDISRSASAAQQEFTRWVEREMGERFVPDRVEVFALRPRLDDEGHVDHAWCRSQYLAGAFTAKAKLPVFLQLSRLGYLLDVRTHSA
jgi:hypothetical protein